MDNSISHKIWIIRMDGNTLWSYECAKHVPIVYQLGIKGPARRNSLSLSR
jgi:hypothetical protein